MVSIMTMLLIGWDRYCLVSKGMKYIKHHTRKRATISLLSLWIAFLAIYSIMAFTWSTITKEHKVNFDEECEMEFLTSLSATVVVNFLEFIIPFAVLVMINVAVFVDIRRRSRRMVGKINTENLSYDASTARIHNTGMRRVCNSGLHQCGPRGKPPDKATPCSL